MNVFKRFSEIISANVNSALDRIEDPEKMIDLSIRELEDAVLKMKADLRAKRTEIRRNEELIKELEGAVERWSERARLAAEKDEDDLAREALQEKREMKEKLTAVKEAKAALEVVVSDTEENIKDAEEKLQELKITSSSLKARARLAKDRIKVNERLRETENSKYEQRLEELKLKIEKWESIADISHHEVKKETKPSFEELERDEEIENELARIKREKRDDDQKK